MDAFTLQWWNWVTATENIWPTKPEIFTIWTSREKFADLWIRALTVLNIKIICLHYFIWSHLICKTVIPILQIGTMSSGDLSKVTQLFWPQIFSSLLKIWTPVSPTEWAVWPWSMPCPQVPSPWNEGIGQDGTDWLLEFRCPKFPPAGCFPPGKISLLVQVYQSRTWEWLARGCTDTTCSPPTLPNTKTQPSYLLTRADNPCFLPT